MRKIPFFSLAVLLMAGLFISSSSWSVEEKEEIQKTLRFQDPSQPKELGVDNVYGSIKVVGFSGQEVQLAAHQTIRGRSKEKIQQAKEEVSLEITEEGNTIDLYVDGPFRCCQKSQKWRRWRNPGYQVQFDFELKVPVETSLYLKTVNKGDIKVENVKGEFEVKNVNGAITMNEIAGAGEARTVNGEVKVVFIRKPESDCSFRTINGDLEISFPKNLSADFRLKTFNGDIYSDFPVTYLPTKAPIQDHKKGKFVYKSDRFFGVRVGKGGPEIKLDTLNGDILITQGK